MFLLHSQSVAGCVCLYSRGGSPHSCILSVVNHCYSMRACAGGGGEGFSVPKLQPWSLKTLCTWASWLGISWSFCSSSQWRSLAVMCLLGVQDRRELSASPLVGQIFWAERVSYFSSKGRWELGPPLLQKHCIFAWVLGAAGFPQLSPGADGLC